MKKIFLTHTRKMFLLLVEVNFMGMGTNLHRKAQTDWFKLNEWWEKMGGDGHELLDALTKSDKYNEKK